ncbi:VanW family protein [Adlercreutzia sp. ZJ154]|uniref:VanW family protein n=1 Tax=Adlercreutzia sp. ZJ154 TaxID=2709790 RepID=UPI00197CD325|nr:VanW family protein [Adlercreutzia sp. ZJ154]
MDDRYRRTRQQNRTTRTSASRQSVSRNTSRPAASSSSRTRNSAPTRTRASQSTARQSGAMPRSSYESPRRSTSSSRYGSHYSSTSSYRSQSSAPRHLTSTTKRKHAANTKKSGSNRTGNIFSALWKKSRIACIAVILVLIGVVGFGIDSIISAGHIRYGVQIGEVDVSGMTTQEAQDTVNAKYADNLQATTVFIFDSEETEQSANIDELLLEEEALAEQISLEDSRSSKQMWRANAESLGASVPTDELVQQALNVGRSFNIIDRLSAAIFGWDIPVYLNFSDENLRKLLEDIDSSLGQIRVDWNIEVEDGVAKTTPGNDGNMINEAEFREEITEKFLADAAERQTMVAKLVFTPMRIDEQAAQSTCDAVNSAIKDGATFAYDGNTLETSADMMGDWVSTDVVARGDAYFLSPYFNLDDASKSIASSLTEGETGNDIAVSFQVSGDSVSVIPDAPVVIPSVDSAVKTLDSNLFGAFRENGAYEQRGTRFDIPIDTAIVEGPFTFDEAYANGVITRISLYTTSYTNTKSTQNRNSNIRLAADYLQNSVIGRNGGTWSFSALVGECTPEKGYKDANNIVNGEIVAAPGGGVCQVSTTVFNAVYESGFPVNERHNHSLRMNSYPDGRDAAIAYPVKDLRWTNDSGSDVLLRTSYTDTTVSVALYGVSPGYSVKSYTADWVEGEKFKTKVKVDDTKPEGYKKTETMGTNGVSIYVTRTVTDENGNVVRKDRFDSVYSPVNKVIVTGPNTPVDLDQESQTST